MALVLYRELYRHGRLVHWSEEGQLSSVAAEGVDSREWVMDLHEFSKGMAVAAVSVALAEVAARYGAAGSRTEDEGEGDSLIVITGQGINRPLRRDEGPTIGTDAEGGGTFVLVDEIQRLLIDDYLPPIPSSTVPGNPGRLRIWVKDILLTNHPALGESKRGRGRPRKT